MTQKAQMSNRKNGDKWEEAKGNLAVKLLGLSRQRREELILSVTT